MDRPKSRLEVDSTETTSRPHLDADNAQHGEVLVVRGFEEVLRSARRRLWEVRVAEAQRAQPARRHLRGAAGSRW